MPSTPMLRLRPLAAALLLTLWAPGLLAGPLLPPGVADTRLAYAEARAMSEYPFLNPQHPDVNWDAIAAVNDRRDILIRSGREPLEALQQAVRDVAPAFAMLQRQPSRGGRDAAAPNDPPRQRGHW